MPVPLHSYIPRPRLAARLADALQYPLTLVAAPAGYGKTSLLRAGADPAKTVWLALDETDADGLAFSRRLISALRSAAPAFAPAADSSLLAAQPVAAGALPALIASWLADWDFQLWVVLDDLHRAASSEVGRILTAAVDASPAGLHWVIATREDPSLPLGRWRAQGRLSELRAADLGFTLTEAAAFYAARLTLPLTPDELEKIESRTEGWAAGMQLAALLLQQTPDRAAFLQSFSGAHRHVVDYLLGEVIRGLPETIRQFLLHTAHLQTLTAPLCDAVRQDTGSQALLEQVEQANLFLIPLDETRTAYRYHALFAGYLQARQSVELGSGLALLHKRASDWFGAHDQLYPALQHAQAAADPSCTAQLLAEHGRAHILQGEASLLAPWFEALSPVEVETRPALALALAWCWASLGFLGRIPPLLAVIRRNPAFTGEAAALHALIASITADAAAAEREGHTALALLRPDEPAARGTAALSTGGALTQLGRVREAIPLLEEAVQLNRRAGGPLLEMAAVHNLGQAYEAFGDLAAAEMHFRSIIQRRDDPAVNHLPLLRLGYVGLGGVLHERMQLAEAAAVLEEGQYAGPTWESPEIESGRLASLVRVLLTRHQFRQAAEILGTLNEVTRGKISPLVARQLAALQALLALRAGRLAEAEAWAAQTPLELDEYFVLRELEFFTLVRVWLALGRSARALTWAEDLAGRTAADGRVGSQIECELLRTQALLSLNRLPAARAALTSALALARPAGYRRAFVDDGPALLPLLTELNTPQTAEILQYLAAPAATEGLTEALTARELEVLRLAAAGYSNQQIAETCVVALSTVKSHIKSILAKLQVSSRTAAAARARELGLLSPP